MTKTEVNFSNPLYFKTLLVPILLVWPIIILTLIIYMYNIVVAIGDKRQGIIQHFREYAPEVNVSVSGRQGKLDAKKKTAPPAITVHIMKANTIRHGTTLKNNEKMSLRRSMQLRIRGDRVVIKARPGTLLVPKISPLPS
ncbi:hypothetical protein PoB_004187300 [Plakobranchus ocellatus]|uniref:Uncharacterized protein n=1 Tax=Plakobranchus ocellatus TaxID=259542 RepID=A0AAV4B6X4_9GAST|nr:hypothetical protein PoB_004187300 [Plakobranchus ocellatus]